MSEDNPPKYIPGSWLWFNYPNTNNQGVGLMVSAKYTEVGGWTYKVHLPSTSGNQYLVVKESNVINTISGV